MSDEPYLATDSPKEIWLEPQCVSGSDIEQRCWSGHDPGDCEDCKSPSVRYIRANLHEALEAENKLLRSVLKDCEELASVAKTLTSCRGDDDWVWGIEKRIAAALASREQTGG